jgi:hypothetical protein
VAQYSTAEAWLSDGKELGARLFAERVLLIAAMPRMTRGE